MKNYKQTIIIFEGHDNSGKTTISTELSKRINVPIFKMHIEKHFWDFLIHQRYATEAITQMLEQTGQSVILDRSFPSDIMYSKLFRRPLDILKAFETDARFANMNTLIIYCYKDKDAYQEDLEDKDFVQLSDYDKMKKYYDLFFEDTRCRYIKLNTSDENLEEQLATITRNILKNI